MILTVKTTGKPRGNSATTQGNEYYVFFCHVICHVWRSESDGNPKTVRNAKCTSETKPHGIAFIIGRTQACNLEIHCAISPRCIARLVLLPLATLARAITCHIFLIHCVWIDYGLLRSSFNETRANTNSVPCCLPPCPGRSNVSTNHH